MPPYHTNHHGSDPSIASEIRSRVLGAEGVHLARNTAGSDNSASDSPAIITSREWFANLLRE